MSGLAVLIGGVSTNVAYAGLAPGLVGVFQINAQIPSGTVPGARSVILLPDNGFPSQSRAFIYVQWGEDQRHGAGLRQRVRESRPVWMAERSVIGLFNAFHAHRYPAGDGLDADSEAAD